MTAQPKTKRFFTDALPSQQTVAVGFTCILVMLLFNAFVLYRNMEILRLHQAQMRVTSQIHDAAGEVLSVMKDAETGQRGFQITGAENFLEPFYSAKASIEGHLTTLRSLSGASQVLKDQMPILTERIGGELRWLDEAIRERRLQSAEQTKHVFNGRGKEMMDAVRASVHEIVVATEQTRSDLQEQVASSVTMVDRSFIVVTLVNLLLAWVSFFYIRRSLRQQHEESARQKAETWLRAGLAQVSKSLLGDFTLQNLCQKAVNTVAMYLDAPLATVYASRQHQLYLQAHFGGSTSSYQLPGEIPFGQGLVGAAAAERRLIHLENAPADYLRIESSTGGAAPVHVAIVPLLHQQIVKGVLEIAGFRPFTPLELELLQNLSTYLAASIDSGENRSQLQELLVETQRQAEELQSQQEELRVNNEELESQAAALKAARDGLQVQQEELQQTNEELEQQARALEAQKGVLEDKNFELERARRETEAKAKELEISSRYKSEFLANMSHELRTPLNSLLILATLLSENRHGHLDDKELEFSRTIHRAGSDLLNLINDILDLSKVEAGKLDLQLEPVQLHTLVHNLESTFAPMAAAKGLVFRTETAADVPATIISDSLRVEQILRNFLSNAVKFTSSGEVVLRLTRPPSGHGAIAFAISDTGIGIAKGSLALIFEAFQQADGSTSRKFGGTGLGLTISRELAALLQGSIEVESTPGSGSTFSLYLPAVCELREESEGEGAAALESLPRYRPMHGSSLEPRATEVPDSSPKPPADTPPPAHKIGGDTSDLNAHDRIILIIEDDETFAATLVELAHESGFKALSVSDGEAGIELLDRHLVHAVILDVKLPDTSGLSILERIKHNPKTRHLPIHMVSGVDHAHNAMQLGAIGYLLKPASLNDLRKSFIRIEQMISKTVKKVLIVEDDQVQRNAVSHLIGGSDIETVAVASGAEALQALAADTYDCMILDLKLPDISGFELLERIESAQLAAKPPVVIYTGKDLSKAEITRLQHYSESIVIKGARSPERLLDEVSLFLHRVEADMPQDRQMILQTLREKEKIFEGKKVLVVDDDMRNVFALANALERRGIKVVVGRDGTEALTKLRDDPEIAMVLMDIMMPQMDGYEAMRLIRADGKIKKVPIIALTAKAMRGDQEKCLEAGANDYLPKPVDLERLLSLMRVWLPRGNTV